MPSSVNVSLNAVVYENTRQHGTHFPTHRSTRATFECIVHAVAEKKCKNE